MIIGAYWSSRAERREAAAFRVESFLVSAGTLDSRLGTWYRQGRSRREALQTRLVIDSEHLLAELRVNRRDVDRQPIPELGYSLSVWNGGSVSFSADIGAYCSTATNCTVLDVDEEVDLERGVCRSLLQEMVRSFEPEHGVVKRMEPDVDNCGPPVWESGWFTYSIARGIQEHSAFRIGGEAGDQLH